ncbi:uncharacterized protein LOC124942580 [Impatiens glandulifera]|uniref:uncharacterized protein LOC124942580 n=1 Tax=Impatiens glandulifera TaxID=253017 RepID=UPI001FB14E0F|nr:uncharacterized protein LOC124942580 [Impatiens glandulifera]
MEIGVQSPETGRSAAGIVMEFSISDDASSPPRIPPRLRKRLLENKPLFPSTVEEIEAKLRDADLRRKKYYNQLSSKARTKPRSPSKSFSSEEDPGQRLEAKLQAAEQKRLSMLENSRMRLARLDELRQAARTGVELRSKKERDELVTKVELRVQQAEANRLLLLKAYRQKRATLSERTSQSLLRRMIHENRYKETVRAAIHQKRAAAETKRLLLLEAEKKRASARMQKLQKAKSVLQQREAERRRMMDKLDNRLQKARRQRAELLRQRVRQDCSVRLQWDKIHDQAEHLSRKLAWCWRRFQKENKTTLNLVKAYESLNIKENTVETMPFEQFASLIESPTTLQTVKALLDRLEIRYKISKSLATTSPSTWNDIQHLLKRVVSPKKRTPRRATRTKNSNHKYESTKEIVRATVTLSRYQVRIVLCAYMILGHPDAVFSGRGEREISLADSAKDFVKEFELLSRIILGGPIKNSDEGYKPGHSKRLTFRSQLAAFDAAWCSYLNSFVAWKVKDAKLLEDDLVRAACQLELSMIQTCKVSSNGDAGDLTHDMKAIQKQVNEDQKLLREKVHHLSGDAGVERMESSLSDTRMQYFHAKENGRSPVGSPIKHILSPNTPSSSSSQLSSPNLDTEANLTKGGNEKPSRVVRSLFKDDSASNSREGFSISHGGELAMENEIIVNEMIHDQSSVFVDGFHDSDEDQNKLKNLIRETMEKAFWDGVMESMKEEKPNNDKVVQLLKEVRDGICDMAPWSWKEEICESIDVDLLSQVLNSGDLDMGYLGRILDYALTVLRKLAAPANENDLKVAHQKVLNELAEICQSGDGTKNLHVIALVKGLRFVLEQIQALKQEISKARIRLMEPVLKGPAGLEYLKKAFGNRYGHPSDALTNLPLTNQWISSVWHTKDEQWAEHMTFLSGITENRAIPTQTALPSVALRTGGSSLVKLTATNQTGPSLSEEEDKLEECKGEKVDLSIRVGLLKLVSGVAGLTHESLPETLKLNLSRLRNVQAQFQTIIVTSTSVLVLRQIIHSHSTPSSSSNMDNMISTCVNELLHLLEKVENAGIKEIIEILFKHYIENISNKSTAESTKNVMTNLLKKSLQAGDPVFMRVSRAIYLATRGVVLGGNGSIGRELAEMALRPIGALGMVNKVVSMAQVVMVVGLVSGNVHGQWYAKLTENM